MTRPVFDEGPRLDISATKELIVLHREKCTECMGLGSYTVSNCKHSGECECDVHDEDCSECSTRGFADVDCGCGSCSAVKASLDALAERLKAHGLGVAA